MSDVWKEKHGIVSAWHEHRGTSMGVKEEPTWRSAMNRATPEFMIDYIFVPKAWSVQAVGMQESCGSDHLPVVATLDVQ